MILDNNVLYTALPYLAVTAVLSAVLLFMGLHLYFYYTWATCISKTKMNGKTIIITGCTSGIGKETVKDLAFRGARIIMACRNMDNANVLKDEIIKETNNNNIVIRKLDLSSLQSIREFARQINQEESRLDVLIHNAGIAEFFHKEITEDGLEMTMATNHFGPFLLTHLLINLLKQSKPSRIVTVASIMHQMARLNLDRINMTSIIPGYKYYVSKYANIVFTLELARRLEGTGVSANCLHPGMVDTGIWRNVPVPLSWFLQLIIKSFFKTPVQGAQTTIHVAISEKVNDISGKYFVDCAEHSLSDSVKDPIKGKKFWELSEFLVKLQPSDPKI